MKLFDVILKSKRHQFGLGLGIAFLIIVQILNIFDLLSLNSSQMSYYGFFAGFLSGFIIRERGWLYGIIPSAAWYFFIVIGGSVKSSLENKSLAPLAGFVMLFFY